MCKVSNARQYLLRRRHRRRSLRRRRCRRRQAHAVICRRRRGRLYTTILRNLHMAVCVTTAVSDSAATYRCPYSARTVPVQCPYSARMVFTVVPV